MKSLQFELWQECNNLCDFCYLGKDNRFTADSIKIESLKNALQTISDMSHYPEYEILAYIGGEFFQGQLANQEVKYWFMELMKKTAQLYNSNIVKQVWITATMTIGNQTDMYETLDLFEDHSNVWVTTSWDSKGRFKTQKMEDTWLFHMHKLREKYPQIKINTTTILTNHLITKYLNHEFKFYELMDKWGTTFFFKQCGSFSQKKLETAEEYNKQIKIESHTLPYFYPTREKFLKFLTLFCEQEPIEMRDRLFNIKLRADSLVRGFNTGKHEILTRFKNESKEVSDAAVLPCGHPVVYSTYLNSMKCILCDKIRITKLFS